MITTGPDSDAGEAPVFFLTRRELVVLTVSIALVVGALLLLVVTSGQVATALAG